MDFEGVFVLIGLALFVWSLIRKKKKKGRAAASSAPKQGLLSRVTDRIRLFISELEKQVAVTQKTKEGAKGDSSPWDRLTVDKQPRQRERNEVADEDDAPLEWKLDSVEAEYEPAPPLKVSPPQVAMPPTVVSKSVLGKGGSAPRPGYLNYTPDTLRNAVVWSEILSPPLALREDDP